MEGKRFLPKISGYLEKKGKKRAESREEQNKWMQAVMSALNQNGNATKLCHFRYSLAELPQHEAIKPPLMRQNTLPQRPITNESTSSKDPMLNKIQKFGAYAYVDASANEAGNISPHRLLNNKKSHSEESLSFQWAKNNANRRNSVMEENEDYIVEEPKEAGSVESIETSEGIYEKIPSEGSRFSTGECDIRESNTKKEPDKSYFRENSIYAVPNLVENEVSGDEEECNIRDCTTKKEHEKTYFRENSIYAVPNTDFSFDSKTIYSEPNCAENIVPEEDVDFNKNSVNVENTNYVEIESPSKSDSSDSQTNLNRNEYEYLDNPLYSEPNYRTASSSSDTSNIAAKKPSSSRFRNFTKRLTSRAGQKTSEKELLTTDHQKPPINRKKSRSFIRRVWNRKKTKKKDDTDENEYEVPPKLIEGIDKSGTVNDCNAVQILTEMKNILEKKMPTLQQHISLSESSEPTQFDAKDSISEEGEDAVFSSLSENVCPLLPPRIQRPSVTNSPYHDVPKTNNPVAIIPPKMKKKLDKITIDDILTELELQKPDPLQNTKGQEENMTKADQQTVPLEEEGIVKKLIKKFTEDEVEIRSKVRHQRSVREDTEQDELSKLLDELAKVTSAPLMTPGVTSSLITGNISDEEWLKILPIRCRRTSDPDYDIPRPHRSLPNLPKREESALTATRFFGPILKPTDIKHINKHKNSYVDRPVPEDLNTCLSITPDSLEPDLHISLSSKVATEISHCEEDRNISYHSREQMRNLSYNSHDYLKENNNRQNNIQHSMHVCQKQADENEYLIENCLYAYPKMVNVVNKNKGSAENKKTGKAADSDDESNVFIDSLEVYAEIGTTAF